MTSFGIAIYLEPDEAILRLVDELRKNGFRTVADEPGQVFHVSLVNAESNDLELICQGISDDFISSDIMKFVGPCQFVGRNVAYLEPCEPARAEIIRANRRANECLAGLADVRPFYLPSKYTPHLSLTGGYHSDMRNAINKISSGNLFTAKVTGYGIASWSNGQVRVLKQWAQQ